MKDNRAGLVVKDSDCRRCLAAAIIRPSDVPSQDVLGTLQPFETDHCGGSRFRVSDLNRCLSECVDLLAGGGRLDRFGASVFGYSAPRIWDILVENVGVEPAHDAPRACAQANHLFALARSQPARAG